MRLGLSPEERTVLADVLANHAAELHSEIVHTERLALREALRGRRALVRGLIARLAQPAGDRPSAEEREQPGGMAAAR